MRVLRNKPRHTTQAETRAEAVDQVRQLDGMIGRSETGLRRLMAFGDERSETQYVEAKTRIELIADHAKPVSEEVTYAYRIAQRLTGSDLDAKDFAIGAEQRSLHQPRAF